MTRSSNCLGFQIWTYYDVGVLPSDETDCISIVFMDISQVFVCFKYGVCRYTKGK
jgi:hypothetical protein